MKVSIRASRQRGFSLAEILVALFIAILVAGAVVSLYFANRNVFRTQESNARLQEAGRYVMDVVGRDVRNASFVSCGPISVMKNIVTGNTANWWLDTDKMIWAYQHGDSSIPTGTDGFDDLLSDSDVLIVKFRSNASDFLIAGHDRPGKKIVVSSNHSFPQGTTLFATDCTRSGVFRMSNSPSGPTTTIEYASGAIADAYDNDSSAVLVTDTLAHGGFVSPLVTNAYYLLPSNSAQFASNPCPSDDASWVRRVLVVRTLAGSTNGKMRSPTAVACDVHAFQIRFGLDNDEDLSADEFRTATEIGTDAVLWSRVVSVRLEFMVVGAKPNVLSGDTRYCLDYVGGAAPETCPAASGAVYSYVWTSNSGNGRRVAKVFSTTFSFRNRAS